MRRAATVFALAIAMSTTFLAPPGSALLGPDPDWVSPEFFIVLVGENPNGSLDSFDELHFFRSTGWDFGDRESYGCATIEYITDGSVAVELTFERVPVPDRASTYVRINDKFGTEHGDPDTPEGPGFDHCGMPAGGESRQPDGTDHFPHHTMMHFDRGGSDLATLDLSRNECAKAYWTPGDQAGEAWLWWDEDGPQNDGHHDLSCGGGPIEPVQVIRLWVTKTSPNVSFCTMDSLDGDMCGSDLPGDGPATGQQHESEVSLRLRGHLRATGDVGVPDGTAACRGARTVVIERRAHHHHWRSVGEDETSNTGAYSARLPNRSGTYRARVLSSSMSNGGACEPASSELERYRRH